MQKPAPSVSLLALYKLFFGVGLFSFGGGLTAWFHREVVLVRGWMTNDEFFSGYSLAQLLPGVNSTNMAVYTASMCAAPPAPPSRLQACSQDRSSS
jgi:chromate transporter